MDLLIQSQEDLVLILDNNQEKIRMENYINLRESLKSKDQDTDSNLMETEPDNNSAYITERFVMDKNEETVERNKFTSLDSLYNASMLPAKIH